MEIRGLGLINIQDLFGVASTRTSKRVELVVQLERWEPGREYDRLGIDEEFYETLGIRVPMVRMPVAPGRNVAILVEVAARNQLLRSRGHHAARRLVDRIHRELDPARPAGRSTNRSRGRALMREKRHAARQRRAHGGDLQVRRADRAGRFGQVAGNQGARGSRLLLRRQSAGGASAHAGGPDASAPAARSPERRSSSTSARGRCCGSSRASSRS